MSRTSLLQWSPLSQTIGLWDASNSAWGAFGPMLAINGDLWNTSAADGGVTISWDATTESIETDVEMSNTLVFIPGPPLGYPDIQYGQSPFGGQNTSITALSLPATVSALEQQQALDIYTAYSIDNANAVQLDFAYDIFLTTSPATPGSTGPGSLGPSLEFMIWLDEQNGMVPYGAEITSFSIPTLVNGQLINATWNVYVGGGSLISFALANPPDPTAGVSVGVYFADMLADFDNSEIIDAISSQDPGSTWNSTAIANSYIDSIYLGSEFFRTASSENYSFAINSFDIISAPAILAGGSVNFLSGGAAIAVDPVAEVTEVGLTDLAGATISITSGFSTGDTLNFMNQSGIAGTCASGVLTLTGVATVAAYQTALESITYGSASTDATNGGADTSRTITWTVSDGDALSAPATSTIEILSPPVVTAPLAMTVGVGQSGSISGVSLAECGTNLGQTFTVTVADIHGDLTASNAGGASMSGDGSASLTMSGSLSQVNAALETLTDTDSNATPDTITLTATDSLGDTAATKTVTVTVNGAPVIDRLTAIVGVNGSSAITGTSLSESGNTTGESFSVTVTDINDGLSATGTGVSGSGTTRLSIAGSLSEVNAALATLVDTDNTARPDTITLNASDGFGNTAENVTIAMTVNLVGSTRGGSVLTGGNGPTTIIGYGDDTITGGRGATTISTGAGGSTVTLSTVAKPSTQDTINSGGADTIWAGSGTVSITDTGGKGDVVFAQSAKLTFINGSGASVLYAGTGTVVVEGGVGGGVFHAGTGLDSQLTAGTGRVVFYGGASGDVLTAAGAANDILIAGAGSESLQGGTATGTLGIRGGSGSDVMVAGAGRTDFTVGSGNDTITVRGLADVITILNGHSGGLDMISGFRSGVDEIDLVGFSGNTASNAINSQISDSHGGSLIFLPDGTRLDMVGLASVTSHIFS
jgi:hypothetical protein